MLMKKFITLLLVLTGMVSTANATDYVIAGDAAIFGSNWDNNSDTYTMAEIGTSGVYYLKIDNVSFPDGNYYNCAPLEKGSWTRAFYDEGADRTGDWQYGIKVFYSEDGNKYTLYFYLDPVNKKFDILATPMLRSNIGGTERYNWTYNAAMDFTQDDEYNWHYDISSADVQSETQFHVYVKLNARTFHTYYSGGRTLTLPATVNSDCWLGTCDADADHRWKFSKPSYTFEKVRISLTYSLNDYNFSMKVTPYISKSVSKANKYATLGCDGAALDLSGLAAQSITAYPLTVTSKGKITKGSAITTVLAANTGVLLESASENDETLSIPVSAEAGAAVTNHLIATSGSSVDKVTETGYTNFILANQDEHIGFYMVNSAGNSMGANTAYLHVADAYLPDGSARAFLSLDDETTGIEAVKITQNLNSEYFNIAGQRVAQPTKGLYIVNGKKVIMK